MSIIIMNNPKVIVKQNSKGEWHFADIAPNGKSDLIGGETFKNKVTQKRLERIARRFLANVLKNRIEYFPRRKKK